MEGIQLSLSTLIPHHLGIHHLLSGNSSHSLPLSQHHQQRTGDSNASSAAFNSTHGQGYPAAADVLVPSFDSEKRKLDHLSATLCLAATLTGPGLTVIPSLFHSCGLVSATVVLTLTAWLTERTLYLTCLCARRGGVATLVEVGQVALGAQTGVAIAACVALFALFELWVELVVLTQAWTPAVQAIRGETNDWLVLLVTLLVLLPFLTWREFLSLKRNYYFWSIATVLTLGAVTYLCFDQESTAATAPTSQHQESSSAGEDTTAAEDNTSSSIACLAASLPRAAMAFGCGILNILPIQSSLREPTTSRIQSVIRTGVWLSFGITYTFGIAGYSYADGRLQPNVLLNITSALTNNGAAFLAAVAFGMMIFLALPLIVMPARRSLLELIDKVWFEENPHSCQSCREHCPKACEECCDEDPDEQTCMTFPSLSTWSVTTPGSRSMGSRSANVIVVDENSRLLPIISEEVIRRCNIQNNMLLHAATTIAILTISFAVVALGVSSETIMTVWQVLGSAAGWLISYALPAACFTQIQERDPTFPFRCGWTTFSWFLLTIAPMASLLSFAMALTYIKKA